MNSFNWADYEVEEPVQESKESGFNWSDYEEEKPRKRENQTNPEAKQEEESGLQSTLRTIYAPISGFLNATTSGIAANFWQLLAMGEAYDPEEIDRLEEISRREGIPFDREKYMEAAKTALAYIPTFGNLERVAEEQTGAPFQAKTPLQKALKLGTLAGTLQPGNITQKTIAGATAPTVSKGLEVAGVPEEIAELGGLGISQGAGALTSKGVPAITSQKKTSGLPTRRFEALKKETRVSPERHKIISEKLEKDFRQISDKIIEKSPLSDTISNLKNSSEYKATVADSFKDVEKLAGDIPDKFSTKEIVRYLLRKANSRKKGGFVAGEYEDAYNDFANSYIKNMREKEISNKDLIRQYRKNNEELGKIYESSKSTAYNDAKKDALLDFNSSIADTIQKKYPDTAYSNLFKESNANWAKIMDAEQINQFIDDLFTGKIQYKKGEKFFESKKIARPFKRALGDEGFENFKGLMNDLMSTKEAMSLLKVAEHRGYADFAKNALAYLVSPEIGHLKTFHTVGKELMKATLDKPKLTVIWKNGIEAAKKGKFEEAQKAFNKLKVALGNINKNPKQNSSPDKTATNQE